jgi:hypothetical protein
MEAIMQGYCDKEHLLNFEKLWDAFVQEETTRETIAAKIDEVQDLAFTSRVKKDREKKGPRKGKEQGTCSSKHGMKDLSPVTCFKYHKKGHYASQCLEKKKGKGKKQQM